MRSNCCVVLRNLFKSPYLTSCLETGGAKRVCFCYVTMYPILPEIRNGDGISSAALVDENVLVSRVEQAK